MTDSKEWIVRFYANHDSIPEGHHDGEIVRELIRCKDCRYYDKPHVENNGTRIEYDDLPEEAFENCIGGLVSLSYGINVGGRCCRDYNVGYSEDKRVFVPETNYCGRAERKTDNG